MWAVLRNGAGLRSIDVGNEKHLCLHFVFVANLKIVFRQSSSMFSFSTSKKGFTFVELLVVIGITAILIGMLLPAINPTKRNANAMLNAMNLRTLQQAQFMLAENNDGWFAGLDETGSVLSAGQMEDVLRVSLSQEGQGDGACVLPRVGSLLQRNLII